MTSFIIVAKDTKKRNTFLDNFYVKQQINPFDITTLTLETATKTSQSIGIEDIKKMQEKIYLKPLKSKDKAIVIAEAELLTLEAQNALLKILEEPPSNTFIILSSTTKEMFLPTILSRCQIIQLEEDGIKLSEKEITEFTTFLAELPQWGIGERLKKAEILAKDKTEALLWLEKLILILREKILSSFSSNEVQAESGKNNETIQQYNNQIIQFQTLYKILKTTNANPRFAIEHTLLSLLD